MTVCSENRLRWDLNPEQIQQLSDELIANTKKVYDCIGALDLDGVTFENTLKALADVEVEYTGELMCFSLTSVVARDQKQFSEELETGETALDGSSWLFHMSPGL